RVHVRVRPDRLEREVHDQRGDRASLRRVQRGVERADGRRDGGGRAADRALSVHFPVPRLRPDGGGAQVRRRALRVTPTPKEAPMAHWRRVTRWTIGLAVALGLGLALALPTTAQQPVQLRFMSWYFGEDPAGPALKALFAEFEK